MVRALTDKSAVLKSEHAQLKVGLASRLWMDWRSTRTRWITPADALAENFTSTGVVAAVSIAARDEILLC